MPEFLAEKEVQLKRISERVWKITDTIYNDVEILMNSGYFNGSSAHEISKELTQYLQNPQILTQSEIDNLLESGQISQYQADKLAENLYKPLAQGVYRSSIKNAFRLARTEINMAYHNRDFENRQKLPFVIGINVNLSGEHESRMPQGDMCDDLQGKYPPDFVFSGWHTACLCHTTSILAKESDLRKFYRDEKVNFDYVKGYPQNAKNWIKDNSTRINKAKSKPFWITDNKIKT